MADAAIQPPEPPNKNSAGFAETRLQVIEGMPPELVKQLDEKGKPFEIKKDYEFIDKRFFVDPTGRGVFIFARLPEND